MSGQPVVCLAMVDAPPDERRERLAALFDAHEDRLYRLARRLTGTADQARDLVQETFLKAARSLRSVPIGLASEEAWLVRVLVNIRRDAWRRTAVRKRAAHVLRVPIASVATQESALIAKRAVWSALDVLPPRRRAIVIMHELEGLSPTAIASVLGVAVMTVRWHLSMGRRDLRRALQPFMGDRR